MPMSMVSRKGASSLPALAQDKRVILTSHGRPVAVVDTPERADAGARAMREAAWAVLDWASSQVAERSKKFSTAEICEQLGLDLSAVRARAEQLAARDYPRRATE